MDLLARATRARQRVLAVFNARQSDFESLRAWNDHLERVEALIFNLTEGVDASATESAIAEHKRRNASEIARYAARARDEGRAAMGETAEAMDAGEGYAPETANGDVVAQPVPTSAVPPSAVPCGAAAEGYLVTLRCFGTPWVDVIFVLSKLSYSSLMQLRVNNPQFSQGAIK